MASALTVRVTTCVSKFDGASIEPVPRLTSSRTPTIRLIVPEKPALGVTRTIPVALSTVAVAFWTGVKVAPVGRHAPLDGVGQHILGVGVDAPELEGGDLVQSDGLILHRLEERPLVDRGGAGGHVHPEGLRGGRVGARVDGRHDDIRRLARHRRGRVDVDHAVGVDVGQARRADQDGARGVVASAPVPVATRVICAMMSRRRRAGRRSCAGSRATGAIRS